MDVQPSSPANALAQSSNSIIPRLLQSPPNPLSYIHSTRRIPLAAPSIVPTIVNMAFQNTDLTLLPPGLKLFNGLLLILGTRSKSLLESPDCVILPNAAAALQPYLTPFAPFLFT